MDSPTINEPETPKTIGYFWSGAIGILLVVSTISLAGVFSVGIKIPVPGSLLDGGTQIGLISLIVALAAYLATLARLLKEKLKSTTGSEVSEHKENIAGVTCAEQLVVLMGIVLALRMLIRPFIDPSTKLASGINATLIDFIDVVVLTAFVSVVFFLAWLHYRQWR